MRAFSEALWDAQFATGSPSTREAVRMASQRRASASSAGRSGNTVAAQAGLAEASSVQFTLNSEMCRRAGL